MAKKGKSKSDDSSLKMYNSLLQLQEEDEIKRLTNPLYSADDDNDMEAFVTSEEIVKKKEYEQKLHGDDKSSAADNDGVIEESVYFKRYSTRREHKYTETEMQAIEASCVNTIVHDYGEFDIYHISDEERMKNDQLSEVSLKLQGLKTTYRRVDQYIHAMRVVFEAWTILARTNYLHTEEEFFDMIAEGRIVSTRIPMPKLKKQDQYNMDMIINYISNPDLDPSHLVPPRAKKKDEWDDDDFFFDEDNYEGRTQAILDELLSSLELENFSAEITLDAVDFFVTLECTCERCSPEVEEDEEEGDDDNNNLPDDDFFIGEEEVEEEKPDRSTLVIDLSKYAVLPELDSYCEWIQLVAQLIDENREVLSLEGRPETEGEKTRRLLSSSDAAYLIAHQDDLEKMSLPNIKQKDIKGYDKRTIGSKKKKRKKGESKHDHYRREQLHIMLNKIQSSGYYKDQGNSYMVTHSLFDQEKEDKSFWDSIHFDGSWEDDDAVALLDLVLREELMKQRPIKEKYLTYADKDVERFFSILEENGVSTIDLRRRMGISDDSNDRKVIRATKKENRKMEAKVLNRLVALNKNKKFEKITGKAEKALADERRDEIPGI